MKKTFALIFAVSLLSCKKEESEPNNSSSNNKDCTCGTIANDGIDNGCYWLEIRNECSGNKKTWCFDQDIWADAFVGSRFCVSNVEPW